jgi:hypothetical protein
VLLVEEKIVVAIYKDLHSEGLNIVGVSLDKDAEMERSHRKDNVDACF